MCRQVHQQLAADVATARRARQLVAAQCLRWGLAELVDDAVLPVSELVTNVLVHAGAPAALTITLTGRLVEVSVHDPSPRPPVLRPARSDLAGDIDAVLARLDHLPEDPRDPALEAGQSGSITAGRGLLIVDAVADEWGAAHGREGKDVWFRLATPQGWAPPSPCRCPTSTVTTASGLPFVEGP